jgi:hypothetical protein
VDGQGGDGTAGAGEVDGQGGDGTAGEGDVAGHGGDGLSGGTAGDGGQGNLGASGAGGGAIEQTCPGLPADANGLAECTPTSNPAEHVPANFYLIAERSGSMAFAVATGETQTRWEALLGGLASLLNSSAVADSSFALQWLPVSDAPDDAVDCDPENYATPAVPMGPVADVRDTILDTLSAVEPMGFTPLAPALEGAIQYAAAQSAANPARPTSVIFLTDGVATQCDHQSRSALQAICAEGLEAGVRTFFVAVAEASAHHEMGQYCGTDATLVVGSSATMAEQFAETFTDAVTSPFSCTLAIPEQATNLDELQVGFTPDGGELELPPRLEDPADCGASPNGGWYYDDPDNPSTIRLCDCTCSHYYGSEVELRLGCAPPAPNLD